MEHILGLLLKAIIEGVDGLFEKSLQRAIPDLDQLLDDLQKALDHRDILIGPRRQYFSRTLIGLALACAGVGPCLLILSIIQDEQPRRTLSPAIWLATLAPVAFFGFFLGFRFFRGGYCVLRDEGVEFMFRKRVVYCSWAVFNTQGQVLFIEESNLLLLPISPDATDSIMELNEVDGTARFTGIEVSTPQWETHSPFEAALKPLYVVKIEKLGDLLLQIGRRLATSQPATKAKTFAEEEKRTAASQPQTNMQGKARTRQTAKGRGEDPGFAFIE